MADISIYKLLHTDPYEKAYNFLQKSKDALKHINRSKYQDSVVEIVIK